MSILAFGDSVLMGITLIDGKYQVSNNRFTNIITNETGIEIINYGQMGHTIQQLDNSICQAKCELQNEQNNTIFLEYGGNDCDFNWKEISKFPTRHYDSHTEINNFKKIFIKNISILKDMGKDIYILSLPPIDPVRYIRRITNHYDLANIMFWLDNNVDFLNNWHEMYNLKLFEIAMETNVPIIDISSIFFQEKNYNKYLCKDGIHPNDDGHRLIAQCIIPKMKT